MGIDTETFWHKMTFADYQRRAYYHNRKKNDEYKTSWEIARFTAFITYKVNGGKANTAEAFFPFSWDERKQVKAKPMTQAKANEIAAFYSKLFNNPKA